jgi:hypothetical protein
MQKALASATPTRYRIFMKRVGEGIRGLVGISGGIGYHLAAIRYAPHLWEPFREDLARELGRRIPSPETTDLVVVGPSGGYCFDPEFFGRFRSLTAIDIDPLAGVVIRRRFSGARFIRQDFFRKLEAANWNLARWAAGVDIAPGATLLFSNVLGQLPMLFGEARMRELGAGLVKAFRPGPAAPFPPPMEWLSFHDRFSARLGVAPRLLLDFPVRPTSRELADAWTEKWGNPARPVGEIEEHEIGQWIGAAKGPFRYLPWRLDSRRTQLIEICGSGPGSSG